MTKLAGFEPATPRVIVCSSTGIRSQAFKTVYAFIRSLIHFYIHRMNAPPRQSVGETVLYPLSYSFLAEADGTRTRDNVVPPAFAAKHPNFTIERDQG